MASCWLSLRSKYGFAVAVVTLYLLMGASSCGPRVEGCTDPAAANFNAEAERDCCCQYFPLRLSLNHSFQSLPYSSGGVHVDAIGDSFQIVRVALLLSGFQLHRTSTDSVGLRSVVAVRDTLNRPFMLADNFVRVSPEVLQREVGGLALHGAMEGLSWQWGLSAAAAAALPTSFPVSHPLALALSSDLYRPALGGYQAAVVQVRMLPDSTLRSVTVPLGVLGTSRRYKTLLPRLIDADDALNIALTIDYGVLLHGIAWRSSTDAEIINLLIQNVGSAISLQ